MILVDPRIGKKDGKTSAERLERIVSTLRQRVNCTVRGAKPQLPAGDFAFEGNGPDGDIMIGVEWKTLSDACTSMRSDRLAVQAQDMSELYDMSFVIVQGIWKRGNDDILLTVNKKFWTPLNLGAKFQRAGGKTVSVKQYFHFSELLKFFISLGVRKNVIVLRTNTEDETLWALAYLFQWWQKPWDSHQSTDPIKSQTAITFAYVPEWQKMAAELPGVGWTRSGAIAKRFESIHQFAYFMVSAEVKDWAAIDGIGPKTAESIYKAIRRRRER